MPDKLKTIKLPIKDTTTGQTTLKEFEFSAAEAGDIWSALTVNLLIPTLTSRTTNGITVTKNADATYSLSGTATQDTYLVIKTFTATETQNVRITGCPQGGTVSTFYTAVSSVSGGTGSTREFGYGATKQLSAGEDYNFMIAVKSGTVCDNLLFKPMLTANLLATYDDYVPYSGSSGKLNTDYVNLLSEIDTASAGTGNMLNPILAPQTSYGITVTKNADATYSLSGTATRDIYLVVKTFTAAKSQNVRITGCPQGGTSNTFHILVGKVSNASDNVKDFGYGATKQLSAGEDYNFFIAVKSGTVCDNLLFKPMLTANLLATYDDYVPYTGDSGRLNEDIVDIKRDVAQNTTEIATNAADIATLAAQKIMSYTDVVSHKLGSAVYNTNSKCIIFHDDDSDTWKNAYDTVSIDRAGLNITGISSKVNLREANAMQFGNAVVLSITFDINQSVDDGEILFNVGNFRPVLYVFSTAMNGSRAYNHLALNADGALRAWGGLTTGTFFSASFMYII